MAARSLLRWLLVVALLPFAVLGALVLAVLLAGQVRYDPAYFVPGLVERYHSPSSVTSAFGQAVRTGDVTLLAELQGLRRPADFEANPDLELSMVWEQTDRYTTYLYVDSKTQERHLVALEKVRGRWLVAPQDLYHSVRSGHSFQVFAPAAGVWWGLGFAGLGYLLLRRNLRRLRARLWGE